MEYSGWRAKHVSGCIRFLLLRNTSPQTQGFKTLYHLAASVCQEAGTFQLGPPLRVSHSWNQGTGSLCPHLEAWLGKDLLQSTLKFLMGLISLQLYVWGLPLFSLHAGRGPQPPEVTLRPYPLNGIKSRRCPCSFEFFWFFCLWPFHPLLKGHPMR